MLFRYVFHLECFEKSIQRNLRCCLEYNFYKSLKGASFFLDNVLRSYRQ